jgi:hypothetical protein
MSRQRTEPDHSRCIQVEDDMSMGGGSVSGSDTQVVVWEEGTVGLLDYLILSSADGDSLIQWLADEGFELPSGADSLLGDMQTDGLFFFVSRLSATADPELPISPVRFVLPGLDTPLYPLRLTALGVKPGETFQLALWLVYPYSTTEWYDLDSHGTAWPQGEPQTMDEYDAMIDGLFAANPGSLVHVYADRFLTFGRSVCEASPWACEPQPFYMLDIDTPSSWSPEIQEMVQNQYWVDRYEGRLTSANMDRDVTFTLVEDQPSQATNAYAIWRGQCWMCPEPGPESTEDETSDEGGVSNETDENGSSCACTQGGRLGGVWLLGPLLLALLVMSRRSRRSSDAR